MARGRGIPLTCLVVLCFLFSFSHGYAGNLHVGALRIHPYASVGVGYTDNVYLTHTAEVSDTYYLVSPGIELVLPVKKHSFSLNYTADHYTYRERDNADRTIHNATGIADLNPWRRLNIQIRDAFTRGEDLPDFEGGRSSPFIWNSPSIDASYDITSRLAVGAGYQHGTKRYDRSIDQIDDYEENGVSGRFYFRILPKTSLVMVYHYEARDYDERPTQDNDSHRLEGGVTWEITPKSTGTVRVGYMQTDYHRLDRTDGAFSYLVNLIYQLRPKTTVSLEGVREILDTSLADRNLLFGNDYVTTQIAATLSHRYRKFTGRLRAGYIHDDYLHDDLGSGKKRKDNLFRGEFGINYAPRKWLNLGGSYRYTRLNSNFEIEEYTENVFLFFLSVIL